MSSPRGVMGKGKVPSLCQMGCRRMGLALAACVIASCLRCSVAFNLGGSTFAGAGAGSLQYRSGLQQQGAKLAAVRGAARAGAVPPISMQGGNVAGIDFGGPLRGIPVTKSALVEVRTPPSRVNTPSPSLPFSCMRGSTLMGRMHAIEQADVELCYEIAADFGQYLNWARNNGMQEVKVLEEYPDGRGKRVKFRAKPPLGPDLDNELVIPQQHFIYHYLFAVPLGI